MRAFWSAAVGETFGGYLVVGIVVAALALLLAAWLFDRRLLRHG
jgi:hypothetical protein